MDINILYNINLFTHGGKAITAIIKINDKASDKKKKLN